MQLTNWFASVFVCSLVCFCSGEECINVDEGGTCLEHCPENTFVYISGCDNETMSQKTCRQPAARSLGFICDYTRCECHDSKLWDEAAHNCVLLEECSDQSKVVDEEEKQKKDAENIAYSYRPYEESEFYE